MNGVPRDVDLCTKFDDGVAFCRVCRLCEFTVRRVRGVPGVGHGYGMQQANIARGMMLTHWKNTHPDEYKALRAKP